MRTPPFTGAALAGLGLLLFLAAACGGDDGDAGSGISPTPFTLGSTLTIRGQEVTLPQGVQYINQKQQCQQPDTAFTQECLEDLKILSRGNSYIIFDPTQPRVIARRIEPEDEADFRPLLGLISGTTAGGASSPAPSP